MNLSFFLSGNFAFLLTIPLCGDTLFSDLRELYTSNPTANIRSADLNADGLPDLIINGSRFAELYFNSHTGFGPPAAVTNGFIEAFGDLDGDLDLVVVGSAGFNNIKIYWFENEAGVFSSAKTISDRLDNKWSDVVIIDVDQDGDNDLVVADYQTGVVRWFENQLGEDPLTRWAKPQGISPADPDSDGDGDGIPLFAEFAYNLDPTKADGTILPPGGNRGLPALGICPDGSRIRADYEYLRRSDASEVGLTYLFEVSGTMEEDSWIEKSLNTSGTRLGNGYVRVNRTRFSILNGRSDHYFGRFNVSYDPPIN